MVKLLLKPGVDVNAKWYGQTALMLAREKGHTQIVDVLKKPVPRNSAIRGNNNAMLDLHSGSKPY